MRKSTALDLTENKYGRLKALRRIENNKRNQAQWECVCECGNVVNVACGKLTSGYTRSCGCLQKERVVEANTTHGLHETPEYRAWAAMKDRCYNEKNEHYRSYGGRGIMVCDEWKENFEAFYRDVGPRPSIQHSIDRRDNDLGYSKENCHWVTQVEQTRNRRTNVYYEYKGQRKILKDWCVALNISFHKTYYRMFGLGWSFEEAIQPIEFMSIVFDGETKILQVWCDMLNLPLSKTALRILRGEAFEDIVAE